MMWRSKKSKGGNYKSSQKITKSSNSIGEQKYTAIAFGDENTRPEGSAQFVAADEDEWDIEEDEDLYYQYRRGHRGIQGSSKMSMSLSEESKGAELSSSPAISKASSAVSQNTKEGNQNELVEVSSKDGEESVLLKKGLIFRYPETTLAKMLADQKGTARVELPTSSGIVEKLFGFYEHRRIDLTSGLQGEKKALSELGVPKEILTESDVAVVQNTLSGISVVELDSDVGNELANSLRSWVKLWEGEQNMRMLREVSSPLCQSLLGSYLILKECSWTCRSCHSDTHAYVRSSFALRPLGNSSICANHDIPVEICYSSGCMESTKPFISFGSYRLEGQAFRNLQYAAIPQELRSAMRVGLGISYDLASDDELQSLFLEIINRLSDGHELSSSGYHISYEKDRRSS